MVTKRKSKKSNKKKKKIIKLLRNLLVFAILTVAAVRTSYCYFTAKQYDDIIFPGVKIENIVVAGKTKDAAVKILMDEYGNKVLKKKINIVADDKTYNIDYSDLNAKYDIVKAVNEAFAYGRNLGFIKKYKIIKKPIMKEIKLEFSYNPEPVNKTIDLIEKEVNKEPVKANIKMIQEGEFQITPDEKGYKLKSDELKDRILKSINGEVEGDITINAPIESRVAQINKDVLETIDTKISSFQTNFSTSSANRASNVILATNTINGTVLMPGETFSFNEVVGKRTREAGYKEAGVIVNKQLKQGLGGGICQVSTTLYNAVLGANMKTSERAHHTFPSSYAELGMDATVDYGNIDYKFVNTLDYPVYIQGYAKNRILYFNIYSNKSLTNRTYKIYNDVYKVIQPDIKYIDDPNLEEGKEEIIKKAHTGYRVKVYRGIYENGKYVETETLTTDYYVPQGGIIKRGTKKVIQEQKQTLPGITETPDNVQAQ